MSKLKSQIVTPWGFDSPSRHQQYGSEYFACYHKEKGPGQLGAGPKRSKGEEETIDFERENIMRLERRPRLIKIIKQAERRRVR